MTNRYIECEPRWPRDPGPLPQVRLGQVPAEPVGGEGRGWQDLLQPLPGQPPRPSLLQASVRLPVRPQSASISWRLDVADWTDHLGRHAHHDRLEIFTEISPLISHRITKISGGE